MNEASAIILVADGLTPDALNIAIRSGDVPELAALRDENGMHVVTTVFPSVTGVAYVPMLTGRNPAESGIPGLRWYDRSRRIPAIVGHSRSYVGWQMRAINADLASDATTLFERVGGKALGIGAMLARGLPTHAQLDYGAVHTARVIRAHFSGSVSRWARLEEEMAETLIARVRREQPRFVFACFTTGDKATHAEGPQSALARRSLKLVDHVAASIRRDAERDGRWNNMQLWVVSDHGHSPVRHHFDLAFAMREIGLKVRAHPWAMPDRSEAAAMVGGNSMAHVYLDLDSRQRQTWPALRRRWEPRLVPILAHPAVDLIATKQSESVVEVRRGHSSAEIVMTRDGYAYRTIGGNPLGVSEFEGVSEDEAHDRSQESEYPDGVVQLARLLLSERSGDVVISATPGWDLRRNYEPIDHVSSHGALHAAHMRVPLVGNRRLDSPRRTADVHDAVTRTLGFARRPAGETPALAPAGA